MESGFYRSASLQICNHLPKSGLTKFAHLPLLGAIFWIADNYEGDPVNGEKDSSQVDLKMHIKLAVHLRKALQILGGLMITVGAASAIAAIMEIGVYSRFTPGCPFYYEGYGAGALLFAIITWSVVAYIASAAIGLGVGGVP